MTSRFRMTTNVDKRFSTNKKIQPQKLTNKKTAGTKSLSLYEEREPIKSERPAIWVPCSARTVVALLVPRTPLYTYHAPSTLAVAVVATFYGQFPPPKAQDDYRCALQLGNLESANRSASCTVISCKELYVTPRSMALLQASSHHVVRATTAHLTLSSNTYTAVAFIYLNHHFLLSSSTINSRPFYPQRPSSGYGVATCVVPSPPPVRAFISCRA